jgi:hypothetical protein
MHKTTKSMSTAQSMHKFVWLCLGVFALFVVTVPIAITRVSQMEKFKGSHVKSMTEEWKVSESSLPTEQSSSAHP